MKYFVTLSLMISVFYGYGLAGDLKDERDKVSYSIGHQIGGDLKKQQIDIDHDALMQGMEDSLRDVDPRLEHKEMNSILTDIKRKIMAEKRAGIAERQKEKSQTKEKYRGEGRDFLEANARKKGVVTLPSGLQYKVIKKGTGKSPGPNDSVTVHYRGTLFDGREFDSSYHGDTPGEFRVDGVIKGWTEALQLMKEGAKWQLFIPADLAYGERGPLADRAVIFDIELISVNSSE